MNNEEIEKMYEKGIVSLSKILEPLIEKFIQDKNSVDIQQCQLIIHYLIEERKFDENYVDELEKEIEGIKKQINLDNEAEIALNNRIMDLEQEVSNKKEEIYTIARANYILGQTEERSQWYKKINEKIEELDEELEIMKVDNMYGRYKDYGGKRKFEEMFTYKYARKDTLKELIEKEE